MFRYHLLKLNFVRSMHWFRKIAVITFFFVLEGNFLLSSEPYKTISIKFERQVKERNSNEITKGNIYFLVPSKIILEVVYPVNQWMVFQGDKLTIYYPEEKRAFLISSKIPLTLPFFQNFVGVIKPEYGLTQLGYTLAKHKIEGDILLTYWEPPKRLAKVMGVFTLGIEKNKIAYTESRDASGKLVSKCIYKNHIKHGETYFPMEILIQRYSGNDTTFEKVIYSDAQFDVRLPDKVVNFKIPGEIKVERIHW